MVNYFAKSVLIALLVCVAHAFDAWTGSDLEVVLRGGDSVNGANNELRFYHGGYCDIDFPANGALQAGIFGSEGLWHIDFEPNPNSLCSPPVRYKLQNDGNFFIRCSDNTMDYFTHSNQGGTGNYFMAIDNGGELYIFQGTFTCNAFDIQQEVWSSHKHGSWGINDRLYKGQVYQGLSPYDIKLSPSDGNLEVRYPMSHGTPEIVWSAKDEWKAPPGANLNDFYAKLTPMGRLILVGIDYPSMKETEYFAKDLKSGGADCYTLGFEMVGEDPDGVADPVNLIAVPCAL
jgi:hypothetical protein